MSESPITMETEHEGDFDSPIHEFRMQVDSDDGTVDEFWVVKMTITDPAMFEFDTQIFWGDPDTGNEFEAFPLDVRIRDEFDALTEGACQEFLNDFDPCDPWRDAGVTQSDFL